MYRLKLLSILAVLPLSACVQTAKPVAAPEYRTVGAQISSVALFDPMKFAGRWYEVASFRAPGQQCVVGAVTYTVQIGGAIVVTEGPCATAEPRQALAQVSGPGRMRADDGQELWVLWVDETYRTAVIGTPSGSIGYVLNRDRKIPNDRMTAAREILQWNGYDVSRLQRTGL